MENPTAPAFIHHILTALRTAQKKLPYETTVVVSQERSTWIVDLSMELPEEHREVRIDLSKRGSRWYQKFGLIVDGVYSDVDAANLQELVMLLMGGVSAPDKEAKTAPIHTSGIRSNSVEIRRASVIRV